MEDKLKFDKSTFVCYKTTKINEEYIRGTLTELIQIDEATLNDLKKEIPTQQFVQPKEIAELVSLICLGKIKNATGASFDLNGASYLR